ncbi:MAG: DUF5680 domain-containing protein [Candidatus Staskawiczbacteria bacterium]|jgi:hypothetical protein
MKITRTPIEIREKIENKVIDWLAFGAGGKLTVTKPTDSFSPADIVVKARGEYDEEVSLYFKIQECTKSGEKNTYKTEVKLDDFKTIENYFLLFVYFDIVFQDINEYAWLIPLKTFSEISEPATSGKKKILLFESPINVEAENQYTKYLVRKDELANVVERIIKAGGKFEVSEGGLSDLIKIKIDDLKEFISEARRNTYAGEGVFVDNPRLLGSKEFEFQKGDWFYQDIYFSGEKNLIGQEIVYHNNKPIWSMGYFGEQVSNKTAEFLRMALLKLSDKCRLGEKCEVEKKEFRYEDSGTGTIEKFWGEEKISMLGKNIYKLNYQGGLISK